MITVLVEPIDQKEPVFFKIKRAVENNFTSGINATLFAPNSTCTRGQIVTFLYNTYK